MFTTPGQIGQLAREHHRQLLAEASQRQLRHQHYHPAAAKNPDIATSITRRLATAIARAGVVVAEAKGVIRSARPHPLGEPAAHAHRPGHGQ